MLESLFRSLRKRHPSPGHDDQALPRAVAALLVEAARADDVYTEDEKRLIDSILQRQFRCGASEVLQLRAEAEEAQDAANDIYQFSRVVKEGLDRDGKMQLVEAMWRVVLSDNTRDAHEDMLIRRLIGLIHLEDRDSTEARRRAEVAPG